MGDWTAQDRRSRAGFRDRFSVRRARELRSTRRPDSYPVKNRVPPSRRTANETKLAKFNCRQLGNLRLPFESCRAYQPGCGLRLIRVTGRCICAEEQVQCDLWFPGQLRPDHVGELRSSPVFGDGKASICDPLKRVRPTTQATNATRTRWVTPCDRVPRSGSRCAADRRAAPGRRPTPCVSECNGRDC